MTNEKFLSDDELNAQLNRYLATTTDVDVPRGIKEITAVKLENRPRIWKGFIAGGLLVTAAAATVVVVVAAHRPIASVPVPAHPPTITPLPSAAPSPTATASPPSPAPTPDATAGWVGYNNSASHFSFRYKPTWNFNDCQSAAPAAYLVLDSGSGAGYSNSINGAGCGGGALPDAIMVVAEPDSYFGPNGIGPGGDIAYHNFTMEGKSSVTVDGVTGQRSTGIVQTAFGMSDPKGTTTVDYFFEHNGMGYEFIWMHFSGDADTSADFDLLVSKTLKFSA